jgi:ABC-2 type transport system permease protein
MQMQMFGQQPPMPKGDINQLWSLLDIDLVGRGNRVIWQRYNPYPKAGFAQDEWIFVDEENGALDPLNPESGITKGLRQALFLFAGAWQKGRQPELEMTDLLLTGSNSGTSAVSDVQLNMGRPDYEAQMARRRMSTQSPFVVGVHIRGKRSAEARLLDELGEEGDISLNLDDLSDSAGGEAAGDENAEQNQNGNGDDGEAVEDGSDAAKADDSDESAPEDEEEAPPINVVLVADIDWLAPEIFQLREMGEIEGMDIIWKFQNVTLVLNILDALAGEERFIDIRRRERKHRGLKKIEEETKEAREEAISEQFDFIEQIEQEKNDAQRVFTERVAEVEARTDLTPQQKRIYIEMVRNDERRKLDVERARAEKKASRKIKEIDRSLALDVRGVQDKYKFISVLIPPIPPLLVAFFVFFHRRRGEQEGVSRARLR